MAADGERRRSVGGSGSQVRRRTSDVVCSTSDVGQLQHGGIESEVVRHPLRVSAWPSDIFGSLLRHLSDDQKNVVLDAWFDAVVARTWRASQGAVGLFCGWLSQLDCRGAFAWRVALAGHILWHSVALRPTQWLLEMAQMM